MRHYVYALIDPTEHNRPFYIGKGLAGRLQSHFTSTEIIEKTSSATEVVGCDTAQLVAHAQKNLTGTKETMLHRLQSKGYGHRDIARVIARRVDEASALAAESFLIRSVYGLATLSNRLAGLYAERYRPKGEWNFIPGFDLPASRPNARAKYYVYALRNPETSRIFYVGKGTEDRFRHHFHEAKSAQISGKLDELRRLLDRGYHPHDIARVLAWVDEETTAFGLEALCAKFVYGLNGLENIQTGHHHGLFRAKDDWELRKGFDLPFVVDPGVRQDRSEALDGMLGEGLDRPLLEVQNRFPELKFDHPKVLDAADLGIEADAVPTNGGAGARIKIFIRRKRIQIELRHRRKAQREWIQQHFRRLGAYPLRRRDDVFFPDCWRGPAQMTSDVEEAVSRVRQMLTIIHAGSAAELPSETRRLLPGWSTIT